MRDRKVVYQDGRGGEELGSIEKKKMQSGYIVQENNLF